MGWRCSHLAQVEPELETDEACLVMRVLPEQWSDQKLLLRLFLKRWWFWLETVANMVTERLTWVLCSHGFGGLDLRVHYCPSACVSGLSSGVLIRLSWVSWQLCCQAKWRIFLFCLGKGKLSQEGPEQCCAKAPGK